MPADPQLPAEDLKPLRRTRVPRRRSGAGDVTASKIARYRQRKSTLRACGSSRSSAGPTLPEPTRRSGAGSTGTFISPPGDLDRCRT